MTEPPPTSDAQQQPQQDQDPMEAALLEFATRAASAGTTIPVPPELEVVLEEIARDGVPYYTWARLRELLEAKLVAVVDGYNATYGYEEDKGCRPLAHRKQELVEALRSFDGAPFTLQRLAEVLLEPERQYQATHKLLNSLEKVLSVSSTLARRDRGAPDQLSSNVSCAPDDDEGHDGGSAADQMEVDMDGPATQGEEGGGEDMVAEVAGGAGGVLPAPPPQQEAQGTAATPPAPPGADNGASPAQEADPMDEEQPSGPPPALAEAAATVAPAGAEQQPGGLPIYSGASGE